MLCNQRLQFVIMMENKTIFVAKMIFEYILTLFGKIMLVRSD